jgi:hypothetical protein
VFQTLVSIPPNTNTDRMQWLRTLKEMAAYKDGRRPCMHGHADALLGSQFETRQNVVVHRIERSENAVDYWLRCQPRARIDGLLSRVFVEWIHQRARPATSFKASRAIPISFPRLQAPLKRVGITNEPGGLSRW